MDRIKSVITFALFVGVLSAFAAYGQGYESIQTLASYRQNGSAVDFECVSDTGRKIFVKINVCTPDMFRVRISTSQIKDRQEHVVVKNNWPSVDVTVSELPDSVVLKTQKLKLKAEKEPFRLAVYDHQDNLILQEGPPGTRYDKTSFYASMKFSQNEHCFGFGAGEGVGGRSGFEDEFFNRLDKRGQKIGIRGRRVGFFMSTNGYGIFLNSRHPYNSTFRMGSYDPHSYSFETADSQLDYYFIYGPAFKHILGQYTQLTGRAPLIPKWGFGIRQAGYWDQKQVLEYTKSYRDKDIPCDLFHIDSGWVDKGSDYQGHGICYGNNPGGYCDFKWDSRQFPNPETMISEISRQGFKFSLWETALVNPNVGEFYRYGAEHDYFLKNPDGSVCLVPYGTRGPVAVPDFTNPQTGRWWKKQHKPLIDIGVDAFKLDISGDLRTAQDAIFYDGRSLDQGRILHRILNLKTAFEAVADYTKTRGIIFSSIATAGTQRYPVHWSGDYKLTFEALAEMVKSAQNMGLSGFAYYSPDIPAARGIKDPILYTRWAQFGLLNALCQNWYVLPWQLGPRAEDNFRFYAKLHYRLLPYIYSYAHLANQTGVPIVRAMVLEYQNDPHVYDKDLQYFLGRELLIAPVCTESDTREIYLPAGRWIDYATGQKYQGPKNIIYQAPLDRIPIFVKAGAIIPMAPVMSYVDEKPTNPLTLDIYPLGTSSFTLYEDDGTTYDYQKGIFAMTTFVCVEAEDGIIIDIGPRRGKYKVNPSKAYVLKINNLCIPDSVEIAAKKIKKYSSSRNFEINPTGWLYDSAKQVVLVKVGNVVTHEGQRVYIKGAEPCP